MTEDDEKTIYLEGYRDGWRGALQHGELTAMTPTYPPYPDCECRLCEELRKDHALNPEPIVSVLASSVGEPIEVTETPLSDFEHVTL